MKRFTSRPPAGMTVRVSFTGKVCEDATQEMLAKNYWAVAVSDEQSGDNCGRIHLVNWESDAVELAQPPHREMRAGQVWRADGRVFLVCLPEAARDGRVYVYGSDTDVRLPVQFFADYPDAELIVWEDGELASL